MNDLLDCALSVGYTQNHLEGTVNTKCLGSLSITPMNALVYHVLISAFVGVILSESSRCTVQR